MKSEKIAGIVVTVSIHIAVAIPLLALQLGYQIQREQSFVLDFTKQEEKQQEEEKQELHRSAADKLNQMIATAGVQPVRNIAVNRSMLRDDRNTDAAQLYKDAERLAQELRDGQHQAPPEKDDFASLTDPNAQNNDTPTVQPQAYSGATVLSWQLDGRRATHLPVPAYRCYGAGEVTVIITVDNAGRVINAKVDDGTSSGDGCLRNHAIRAARSSKFNADSSAPAKQMGTITYQFVAQ
ncbi:MAG: TonB family protein [Bacteroidales bacterium]|nr:TonB family protein [Bacteroidales bacterium]